MYPTGKKEWIQEEAFGFHLSGADNSGRCRTDEKGKARYYDAPIMEFTDSMLYGCHLDLTYEELKKFCETN